MGALSIQTSRPYLDITTTRARIDITNKIRRFSAKRTPPQMKIERQAASYKVDWSQVWARSRRNTSVNMKKYNAQAVRQRTEQPMAQVQRHANSANANVMYTENYRGSSTASLTQPSLQDIMDSGMELNLASLADSKPNVQFDPGYMKVEWTSGELQIEWDDDFMPEITVTPHSVEIRLAGHKEVKIAVDEQRVAHNGGKKVNKRV